MIKPDIPAVPLTFLLVADAVSANLYKRLRPHWYIFKYGDECCGYRCDRLVIADDIFPRCDIHGVSPIQTRTWIDTMRNYLKPKGKTYTLSRFDAETCHSG